MTSQEANNLTRETVFNKVLGEIKTACLGGLFSVKIFNLWKEHKDKLESMGYKCTPIMSREMNETQIDW